MKYFIMLRGVDGEPFAVVDDIEMVRLFDSRSEAVNYADENCHCPLGYKIYEWDD